MKIAVIGRSAYAIMLKKYLGKGFKIKYFDSLTDENLKKFEYIDVLISMTWGRSIWGENLEQKTPDLKQLKLIHLPGSGIDGINFSKLPRGCLVCNVYEHEIAISEFVLANLLNWEINLINKIEKFKLYNWEDSMLFSNYPHGELNEKKIAIIGYGRIGKEITKKLSVFNTTVTVITRRKIKKNHFFQKNVLIKNLKKNIKEYDYLIIACDLNRSTLNLITKKEIIKMKKNSVLVNVARGPVINEKDLYYSLKNNIIGGAIIDTWYKYPEKDDQKYYKPSKYDFAKLKNVVMTPHLSALTERLLERRIKIIAANIIAIKENKKLINIVHSEG